MKRKNSGTTKPRWRPQKTPLALISLRLAFLTLGALAPRLAARWAHYLWFRPQRYTPPMREQALLAQAQCHPMTHAGKHIAVYSWGPAEGAPTVMLVHGWSGRGTQLGEFVAPLLDAGYRVVTFDAPAHGRSGGRDTNLPEVGDAINLLAREFAPVHAVIAHSFGVPCTMHALRGERFAQRVVALSAPASMDGLLEKFSHALALSPRTVRLLRQKIERRFGADVWQRFSAQAMATEMTLPALVIHDRHDHDVPWREGEAIAHAWPRAMLELTDGLGHRRLLRDPNVIRRVRRFIETPTDAHTGHDTHVPTASAAG